MKRMILMILACFVLTVTEANDIEQAKQARLEIERLSVDQEL